MLFKVYNGFILTPDAPVHARPQFLETLNRMSVIFKTTAHTSSFEYSFFQALYRLFEQAPTGCSGK